MVVNQEQKSDNQQSLNRYFQNTLKHYWKENFCLIAP